MCTLPNAAAMLIQEPTTVSNTFTLPGTVVPRGDLPPLINVTRGNSDEPFLVQTYLACPPGKTCNDPNTDLFSVTLKVAGFSYTMTAGIAPPTPTLQLATRPEAAKHAIGASAGTLARTGEREAPISPRGPIRRRTSTGSQAGRAISSCPRNAAIPAPTIPIAHQTAPFRSWSSSTGRMEQPPKS